MKHTFLLLLVALLGLVAACHRHSHNAAATAYACPMDCEKGKTYPQPGTCPVCKMDLAPVAPTATAYACPMDCEKGKTYPQPGTCPVCKMDLAPVEAAPAAVQDTASSPLKALHTEVMRIHDEAMVEMADMNRLKREMKDFMARARMTQEGKKKWDNALAAIDKAEADMMDWMAAYQEPTAQSEAEAMQYLQVQRDKITKVQADIRAAMAAGKGVMSN